MTIGGAISDSATLAGGVDADRHHHVHALRPERRDLLRHGDLHRARPRSTATAPTAPATSRRRTPGTYRWIANYGGDVNNTATANGCNEPNESVLVNPAKPTIATVATDGGSRRRQDLRHGHPERRVPADLRHGHLHALQRDRSRVAKTTRSSPARCRSAPPARRPRLTSRSPWRAPTTGSPRTAAMPQRRRRRPCGDDNETTVINKFNPDITTSLSSGEHQGPEDHGPVRRLGDRPGDPDRRQRGRGRLGHLHRLHRRRVHDRRSPMRARSLSSTGRRAVGRGRLPGSRGRSTGRPPTAVTPTTPLPPAPAPTRS